MSEEFNTIPSLETKPKNSKLVFILIALFALASFGFYYLFTSILKQIFVFLSKKQYTLVLLK